MASSPSSVSSPSSSSPPSSSPSSSLSSVSSSLPSSLSAPLLSSLPSSAFLASSLESSAQPCSLASSLESSAQPCSLASCQGGKDLPLSTDGLSSVEAGASSFFTKVSELRPGDRGVNCVVRVLRTVLLSSRTLFSGEVASFSEVLVGDETGTIKLELHGEEQRTACRPGTVVLLLHASTAQIGGEMSLQILPRVGGAILPAPKELNLVASEEPCLSDVPLLSLNAAAK
uniref:Nucleic acid-binding protein, putative n=1 Tax=Neospora caninum (strain Liverpool) TaxID=572307 RepID=A0A0F7ULV5_NEOCL|nr:TPA: Nucleic acid-binding protein, putative [Neospora caninum Liverpool]